MFIVSQYLLNLTGLCATYQQLLSYSIALGLILYSSIYLYLLFYNNEFLPMFNSFIFYIIIVDLVLSTYYYFKLPEMSNNCNALSDDTESETSSNSEEIEYVSDYEELDDEDLDEESRDYINNLIEKARISDQQKMSEVLSQDEIDNIELEDEQIQDHVIEEEIEKEHEVENEHEIEQQQKEYQEEVNTNDDTMNQDIDNIINAVSKKKQTGKRGPKKRNVVSAQTL